MDNANLILICFQGSQVDSLVCYQKSLRQLHHVGHSDVKRCHSSGRSGGRRQSKKLLPWKGWLYLYPNLCFWGLPQGGKLSWLTPCAKYCTGNIGNTTSLACCSFSKPFSDPGSGFYLAPRLLHARLLERHGYHRCLLLPRVLLPHHRVSGFKNGYTVLQACNYQVLKIMIFRLKCWLCSIDITILLWQTTD